MHVLSGLLTIRDDTTTIDVPADASAVFRTNGAYAYINNPESEVRFVRLFRSL